MQDETTRLRIELAYDGGPFRGWARQPELPSVQAALEDALELIVRAPCRTVVAGRTDTGVHARNQTVHVDVPVDRAHELGVPRGGGESGSVRFSTSANPGTAPVPSDTSPGGMSGVGRTVVGSVPGITRRLNGALARVLGRDREARGWGAAVGAVVVRDVAVAPAGFDARFSALSRGYLYRVADAVTGHDPLTRTSAWWLNCELDVVSMDRAVGELLGLHDFLSFCKPREGATTVRELQRASVERDAAGTVLVRLTADAFCHHMVRSVVGAVVRVGEGCKDPSWPGERLRAEERNASVPMAPAHGLVLEAVTYPSPERLAERALLTRARRNAP